MIITFERLQRISGLDQSAAVKRWLKAQGVSYLRDAEGQPWITLEAKNQALRREHDDGFTLKDPPGIVPER